MYLHAQVFVFIMKIPLENRTLHGVSSRWICGTKTTEGSSYPQWGAARFGVGNGDTTGSWPLMSREFRATTKNHTGNAGLVYNRKALQVQEKRLFTLLSIIVTDSVTSNKFKDHNHFGGWVAHTACIASSSATKPWAAAVSFSSTVLAQKRTIDPDLLRILTKNARRRAMALTSGIIYPNLWLMLCYLSLDCSATLVVKVYRSRHLLWWGQLVISPLWAEELSFGSLLEIARTHIADRQQASFLHNVSLGSPFPSLPCFPKMNNQPFGIPLSLPQCYSMTHDRAEEQNSFVESMLI